MINLIMNILTLVIIQKIIELNLNRKNYLNLNFYQQYIIDEICERTFCRYEN